MVAFDNLKHINLLYLNTKYLHTIGPDCITWR